MLPQSTTRRIVSTVIVALGVALPLSSLGVESAPEDGRPPDVFSRDVSFENDGVTLHGTVLFPSSTEESTPDDVRHPAVVIVAGSGPRDRRDYIDEARAFAASGVVTLIYDKRTVGYSLTERSYAQLGDDAVAGLRLLQARPDVDAARSGLWGHSEGGWVVPLAAASHADVGFVIVAGASAISPAEVQAWSTCRYLVNSGFYERFCTPVATNLTRLMVAGGIFPEAAYDPLPALEQLNVPTLVVLAEYDRSTAPVTSAHLFSEKLGESPKSAACVVPEADHEFQHSTNGFAGDERFADGYLALAPEWIGALDAGSFACPFSDPAQQDGAPVPLAPLSWYESAPMQAAAGIVALLAFISFPITSLVRRMRSTWKSSPVPSSPVAQPATLISVSGTLALLGSVCLLGYVMATGATESLGPVLVGRPVVWLALQLLAFLAAGAAAWGGFAWWRSRAELTVSAHVRVGIVMTGALVFLPLAAWWGLFLV